MRSLASFIIVSLVFFSCGKDKFTSEPQIKFKSLSPNVYTIGTPIFQSGPLLKIQLTDSEGDFGFSDGQDTSYVYIKNITIPPFNIDSVAFPSSSAIKRKDLDAEVSVDLKFVRNGVLLGTPTPPTRPYTDTIFFEVFVRDFANNKSNTIKTETPLYLITP